MARYDHLPVYKCVYDLNLYFFKLSRGFDRDSKFGLAAEIKGLLTELHDKIIIANNTIEKEKILFDAEIVIERIKFKARMLKDLDVINIKSYKYFFESLLNISKQISKWKEWSEKGRR